MNLLSRLLGAYVLRRLFGGSGRRRGGYRYGSPYGYRPGRRRARSRVGFFGPFPTYSTRTRGGSRVTVSGCCLPIPLGLALTMAAGARTLAARIGARA